MGAVIFGSCGDSKKLENPGEDFDFYTKGEINIWRKCSPFFFSGKMPILNNDEDVGIIIQGYVILNEDIQDSTKNWKETASRLIAEYERGGTESILNSIKTGAFNIILFDFRTNLMFVINDRFGLFPLFYHQDKYNLVFGTRTKEILNIKKFEPDWTSIAEFLEYGYVLGDRTYFEGVRLMGPGSVLSYNLGDKTIKIESYWEINYDKNISEKDMASEALRLFKTSCKRLYTKDYGYIIPLSGGLDSRLNAYGFSNVGKITTLTFDRSKSGKEYKIAKKISDKIGCNHIFKSIESKGILDSPNNFLRITEGYEDMSLNFLKLYQEFEGKVIVDGYLGDVVLGGTYYSKLKKRPGDILNQFLGKSKVTDGCNGLKKELNVSFFTEKELENLFSNEISKKIKDGINAHNDFLTKEMEILSNKFKYKEEMIEFFKINNRGRRFINLGGHWQEDKNERIVPFFDYDFFDFCMNIPIEERAFHKVYYKLLSKMDDLGKIVYNHSGISANSPYKLQLMTEYLNEIWLKQKKFINRLTKGRYCKPDTYAPIAEWVRDSENEKTIMDSMNWTLINKSEVERLFNEHKNFTGDNSKKIVRLFSFSLWWDKIYLKHLEEHQT